MAGIQGRVWRAGQLQRSAFELAELSDLRADPELLVWLDLVDPEPAVLATLADELALNRHAVEDAVAPHERPKATRHASHLFLTCDSVTVVRSRDDLRLESARVSAFVLPNTLVTVRLGGFEMDEVIQRWAEHGLLEYGVGALLHGLLDTVIDDHFEAIQTLDEEVEVLEDLLFSDNAGQRRLFQQRIFEVRKVLAELRRRILPMREVVSMFVRLPSPGAASRLNLELESDFEDLYDHALRAADWSESLREVIGNAFETNVGLQNARLNDVMKKLAAWAAIIAVPTAVTSWFGQNLPVPGYGALGGVVMSAGLIVIGAVGLFLLFRRVDWI